MKEGRAFLFLIFLWKGRLQGWKEDREGLENEWDWGARCEIPRESIFKKHVNLEKKINLKLHTF